MKRVLKILFFMIIGPGSVIVLIPYLIISFFSPPDYYKIVRLQYIGIIPFLIGLVISLRCFYDFISVGKGTPVPIDPPKKLVIIGMYRFVRNPMYIGILFLLFGEAIFFKSFVLLGYTACVYCLFQIFIIGFEEPMLKTKFGKEYEDYCKIVPRWLIHLSKNK
ncbi:MAG: isoprenylcysteine carboxylmethyltransferase family protein [Desulfobacteraceae bacterium]|nr:isoprenylcysteine carboxylmethyltransferase family protein [Desulfobacteraceae bacterium]